MTFSDLETFPIRKLQKVNHSKRSTIKQQIINYYDLSQIQFTSKEVQKHLVNLKFWSSSIKLYSEYNERRFKLYIQALIIKT